MCQTFRSSYERVLGTWAKWMEQTGIKQTMWELWVGRTQPEKALARTGIEFVSAYQHIFDSLQLSFQERERRMCGLYQIRLKKGEKTERGHCGKQSKMFDIDLLFFFCEMKWDSWCTLCLLSVGQLSSPPHLLWTVFKSVASDSTFSLISLPPDIKVGYKGKDAWQRPTQPELGAI